MKKTTTSLLTAFTFILLTVTGCIGCFEKPGEGKKAEKCYEVCNPIIIALDSFYKKNIAYPDSLSLLVPNYIKAIPVDDNICRLEYRVTNFRNSFSLTFTYTGPGVNHCMYTPEKKWECYGYY